MTDLREQIKALELPSTVEDHENFKHVALRHIEGHKDVLDMLALPNKTLSAVLDAAFKGVLLDGKEGRLKVDSKKDKNGSWKKCGVSLLTGYKSDLKLIQRSNDVLMIDARIHRATDTLESTIVDGEIKTTFTENFLENGDILGAFAFAQVLFFGKVVHHFKYMRIQELEKRRLFKQTNQDWRNTWHEKFYLKTSIKELCAGMPQSAGIKLLLEDKDDDEYLSEPESVQESNKTLSRLEELKANNTETVHPETGEIA